MASFSSKNIANNTNVSKTDEILAILSSFSLKFKYEGLLNPIRELTLPTHYKTLYKSFCYLDKSLNFFKLRSKVSTLEDVKTSIETTYKQ